MNDEIVAALERERLGGMPRWTLRPAWEDEARRRLQADAHAVDELAIANRHRQITLVELHESKSAPAGNQGLTTDDCLGVA